MTVSALPDPTRPAALLPESALSRALPNPLTEPTITIPRAAAILGISRRHAYTAVERNEIPSISVGQRKLIPTARFLEKYQLSGAPLAA